MRCRACAAVGLWRPFMLAGFISLRRPRRLLSALCAPARCRHPSAHGRERVRYCTPAIHALIVWACVVARSKTNELWKGGLRDWATPDSAASVWKQNGKWKHTNVHRCVRMHACLFVLCSHHSAPSP